MWSIWDCFGRNDSGLQEADPYGQIVAVFLVCIFFNYVASSSILVIKTFINKDWNSWCGWYVLQCRWAVPGRILDISISCAVQQHTTGSWLLTKVLKAKLELWIVCRSLCCCINTGSTSSGCVLVSNTQFFCSVSLYLWICTSLQCGSLHFNWKSFCCWSSVSAAFQLDHQVKHPFSNDGKLEGLSFFLWVTLSARASVKASVSLQLLSNLLFKNLLKFSVANLSLHDVLHTVKVVILQSEHLQHLLGHTPHRRWGFLLFSIFLFLNPFWCIFLVTNLGRLTWSSS